MNGEINNLLKLQCQLQYYVIDAEVCLERHYSFNDVVTTLKQEIQLIEINIFTDDNVVRDINLIQQLTINN